MPRLALRGYLLDAPVDRLSLLGGRQEWRKQAACTDSDIEFVTETQAGVERAQAVYETCPVRSPCLSFGIETKRWGVWGGVLLRNGQPGTAYALVALSRTDIAAPKPSD